MSQMDTFDRIVSVYFQVMIDNFDLGYFTSCDGLSWEITLETREEGGMNDFVHQLPTRMKYGNVKLMRPLSKDTEKISKWFASMNRVVTRSTATINALPPDDTSTPVAKWQLFGVVPVRWTGPQFTVDSAKVATETLEIAHQGFFAANGM